QPDPREGPAPRLDVDRPRAATHRPRPRARGRLRAGGRFRGGWGVTTALFGIAGAVALIASVIVVTSRRIVHAALWLVVALGAVAGCFGVLHAEFVALVQILVYVGAIVVLVLFALMLTKAPTNPLPGLTSGRSPFAAVVAAVLALILGTGVVLAFGNEKIK